MVKRLTLRIISTAAVAMLLSLGLPAFAQTTDQAPPDMTLPEAFPQIEEQLDITVTPEAPKSGDSVTISVAAYDLDLNTRPITWTLNGKEASKGVGQKTFTFTVGQAGTVTSVRLSIATKYGTTVTRDFTFSPVDVDVLWQANTYTPPFYKGKALYSPEANITFVAMPNIFSGSQRVNSSDVVYTWKLNYDVQGSLSGFGKNTFDYTGPIFMRGAYVEAQVYSSLNPSLQGVNGVTVTPENPSALVYEDNPLLGILFNKAIWGDYNLSNNEVTMAAYPYFFSTIKKNSTVNYNWVLNGSPMTNLPSTQNNITLRRSDAQPGQSALSVMVGNESKILQQAANGFTISY